MEKELQVAREQFLLTLPEPSDLAVREKKYVSGEPDVTMLNEEQVVAFNGITQRFVPGFPERMSVLKGYAGTGKTFVVARLVNKYLFANKTRKVCMTAPTNKAVRIMKTMAEYEHTNLEYMTVHSMLALKEEIKDGKQVFVRDFKREPSVSKFDVVIVDEASMLDDNLFHMLMEEMEMCTVRFLFVGDPCQIPPVNREDCIPFDVSKQEEYNMKVFELTRIVRQAEGNPLIAATLAVRNNLGRDVVEFGGDSINESGEGIIELSSAEADDMDLVSQVLKTYFRSDNFTKDPDFMKVVAWTNKTVDAVNDLVRGFLYGKKRKKLEVGERLIANTPIMREETILLNTNDEMLVISFELKEDIHNHGAVTINYYEVVVEHLTKNGTMKRSIVWVVHENSEATYNKVKEMLASYAKKQQRGSQMAGMAWKDFYKFIRRYADVKYNYAITAHKSQGSTYTNTMVMVYDIAKNSRVRERNRILYTACSRPKKKLMLVGW